MKVATASSAAPSSAGASPSRLRIACALTILILPTLVVKGDLIRWVADRQARAARELQLRSLEQRDEAGAQKAVLAASKALKSGWLEPTAALRAAGVLETAGAHVAAAAALDEQVLTRTEFASPATRLAVAANQRLANYKRAADLAAELAILQPVPRAEPGALYAEAGRALAADGRTDAALRALLDGLRFDDRRAASALDLSAIAGALGHPGLERHFLVRALLEADLPGRVVPLAAGWFARTGDLAGLERFVALAGRRDGVAPGDFEELARALERQGAPAEAVAAARAGGTARP